MPHLLYRCFDGSFTHTVDKTPKSCKAIPIFILLYHIFDDPATEKRAVPQDSPKIFCFPKVGAYTVPTTTKVLTPGTTVQAPVEGLRE